jgi:uncharacterized protein YyaL (SSP411 family)
MANRLQHESSPYLRQHSENPIDWFPWGEEAFDRAMREDKPVLLSIGYSSCHWCHVMAHESFENEELAAFINERFISIKVDREELPEVDDTFMTAVQLSGGRGGWPMTLFLTPQKMPFFAGTYFPLQDRGDHAGFRRICHQLAEAWQSKRSDVLAAADQYSHALREALATPPPPPQHELGWPFIHRAVAQIIEHFDPENGGFGGAPKFPPHAAIRFLTNYAASEHADKSLRESSEAVLWLTRLKMQLGGIHDHVGGGYHRYSTDSHWLLPHFEKMLYDNALLMQNGFPDIAPWILREMRTPDGLFGAALDADSEGEEGKYYVWTVDEIKAALGTDANEFMALYNVKPEGNFHDEATGQLTATNIPYLEEPVNNQFEKQLATLRALRSNRPRPMFDNKAIVAWNGLAVSGLAAAGELEAALTCALAVLAAETSHGRLPHQIVEGVPQGDAYLDDYAALILGIQDLLQALPGSSVQSALAGGKALRLWDDVDRLTGEMCDLFQDPLNGGFFMTSNRHENLFGRTKPVFDQPIPSGNSLAVRVLSKQNLALARHTAEALIGWMERAPAATEGLLDSCLKLLEVSGTIASPTLTVSVRSGTVQQSANGAVEFALDFNLPEGMRIYVDGLDIASKDSSVNADLSRVAVPFRGRFEVPVRLERPRLNPHGNIELEITFQLCSESECQRPETVSCVVELPH